MKRFSEWLNENAAGPCIIERKDNHERKNFPNRAAARSFLRARRRMKPDEKWKIVRA